VKALASIPTKEVLLAQLLGLMQSPVSRMARVLAAIAEKRTESAPAPVEAAEAPAVAEAPVADAPAAEAAAPAA
jgi:large subunit ribosomal protein L10